MDNSTAFIDSEFVRNDHEMLEEVLRKLKDLDVGYLPQLLFTRKRAVLANSTGGEDQQEAPGPP